MCWLHPPKPRGCLAVWVTLTQLRSSLSTGEPFVGTRETRSHMQPGKQPRGTERQRLTMQGAHLPPTPIWTRAPRQHLVLLVRILCYRPSLPFSPIYMRLFIHFLLLVCISFEFRREKLWFVGSLIRIPSSLIFFLRSLKDKNCCDLYPFLHRFPLTRLYFVGI